MRLSAVLKSIPFLLAVLAGPARADETQDHGNLHESMHHGAAAMPTEAGQGAFAAIQEIVAILKADPHTDWGKVDLALLRRHLVDMDALVTLAEVTERPIPGGIEATVSGAGRGGEAARRMVPAHAAVLPHAAPWAAEAEIAADGTVVLRVTSDQPAAAEMIRGLGFFGLMATGAHHQAHHLAIARGQGMPH